MIVALIGLGGGGISLLSAGANRKTASAAATAAALAQKAALDARDVAVDAREAAAKARETALATAEVAAHTARAVDRIEVNVDGNLSRFAKLAEESGVLKGRAEVEDRVRQEGVHERAIAAAVQSGADAVNAATLAAQTPLPVTIVAETPVPVEVVVHVDGEKTPPDSAGAGAPQEAKE